MPVVGIAAEVQCQAASVAQGRVRFSGSPIDGGVLFKALASEAVFELERASE